MHSVASCAAALLFLAGCIQAEITAEYHWTYENETLWGSINGSYCEGSRQSPINITTSGLVNGSVIGLTTLAMTQWNVPISGKGLNDGHTVKYTLNGDVTPTTETYLGRYNLVQFHFHWGAGAGMGAEWGAGMGAEHLIDGFQYNGELHFVHESAKQHVDRGNAYTVVGVLLAENSTLPFNGTVWDKLVSNIPAYNRTTDFEGIVLNDMLPGNLDYYYYNGSLTTPPCDEIVQWVLLRNAVDVPAKFFAMLEQTQSNKNGTKLVEKNYRQVQLLNDRQVYQYPYLTREEEAPTSAALPTSASALLLLAVIIGSAAYTTSLPL